MSRDRNRHLQNPPATQRHAVQFSLTDEEFERLAAIAALNARKPGPQARLFVLSMIRLCEKPEVAPAPEALQAGRAS